jgi:hypothetical protein
MGNQAKRLAAIEKALEHLLARDKYYILVRADDTPQAAEKWHLEHGLFDPAKQEPFFIFSKIPGVVRHHKSKQPEGHGLWPDL